MIVSENLLFTFGRPFSPIYSFLMKLRERLYFLDIIKRNAIPVPIISVGNIVLGGTGKTPTVKFLAEHLCACGYKPAIISRGYKGKAKSSVNIVSDGSVLRLSPEEAGDEPYMLASTLPGVPVLTGIKRVLPARYAVEKLNADILILDDAFQHLSVRRDIDIVLFDGTSLAGNSRVFPGGDLREPISALNRCNCFLITGKNKMNAERVEKFKALLEVKFKGKLIYTSETTAVENKISNDECYAFCGIAHPDRFLKTAAGLNINIIESESLTDHVTYTQNTADAICRKAKKVGAKLLLTTEKDYVKISQLKFSLPISYIKIKANPEPAFSDFINAKLVEFKTQNGV